MRLRYGMNPHQRPASVEPVDPGRIPFQVINGEPSYINVLDAVSAWQLVREAAGATGRTAASSFKHVSPAGAALAGPIDAVMAATYRLDVDDVGPLTSAYVRARDADPKSSYGDVIAVSEPVDAEMADLLRRVVSDGIIAPGYDDGVVATLSGKKRGAFLVLEADPAYRPPAVEIREAYGLRFTQPVDDAPIGAQLLAGSQLPASTVDDLVLGLCAVRYTQSNSVAYVRDGMALGIGAGQQSRIDCTALAGSKVDNWWLRRHPDARTVNTGGIQEQITAQIQAIGEVVDKADWCRRLDGVAFVSDGALPFADNVLEARRHGVRYIAEPGGSIRSPEVVAVCAELGITVIQTGLRLFRH